MRAFFTALALGVGLLSCAPAFADDPAPATESGGSIYGSLEQIPLTDDQLKHYVDAMSDMQAAVGDAPADAAEPDAKTMAKLEATAKKHGFKDFNEYNTVAGNIALVLDGVDPDTKSYVGADKLIQKNIAEVKADKELKDDERRSTLADLQAQLKTVMPVKYKSNIDLILKNYDKLAGD